MRSPGAAGSQRLRPEPCISTRARGPSEAFLVGTEFAHLHGDGSGSLHVALPREVVTEAIDKGWAEMHPAVRMFGLPSTLVMLHGPRDQGELETLWRLVQTSYEYARGASDAAIGDA